MTASEEQSQPTPHELDVSFVVIGFNESKTLKDCLESVKSANLEGLSWELIYVDGGSTDSSIDIAQEIDVDHLLGGEKRRRAAENRNLGLAAAKGRFVQFVDGDMTLSPDWPKAAIDFLEMHDDVAAACGNLEESNDTLIFKALEIDWVPREGAIRHCGGAAMYVSKSLREAGGFPADVAYGEEPLLCWRLRNNHGKKIYQLNRVMAQHNLDFRGLRDYWRRSVRCGQTYAEIASRCWRTSDPLWRKECVRNVLWAGLILFSIGLLIVGPLWMKGMVLIVACFLLARKLWKTMRRGYTLPISFVYAIHVYLSKVGIAWGEVRWVFRRLILGRA